MVPFPSRGPFCQDVDMPCFEVLSFEAHLAPKKTEVLDRVGKIALFLGLGGSLYLCFHFWIFELIVSWI